MFDEGNSSHNSILLEEDNDLNFVESSIESSKEELLLSVTQCYEEMESLTQEAEMINDAADLVSMLNGQTTVLRNVKHQLMEFLNRTSYLQSYANNKQQENVSMKMTLKQMDKELESAHSKINYQQEEIESNMIEKENHCRDQRSMETEIQDLLNKMDAKDQLLQENRVTIRDFEQLIEDKVKVAKSQMTSQISARNLLKTQLVDKCENLEALSAENDCLRERCQELSCQLNEIQNIKEQRQNEGSAVESALNKAVSQTLASLDLKRKQMDEQQQDLLEQMQVKDDQIAQLQIQLQSREALQDLTNIKEDEVQASQLKDRSVDESPFSQHFLEDKEELKQCDALFGQISVEKSRISILSEEKSGLPENYDHNQDNSGSSVMMFENGLQDLQTGESLKQKQISAEFGEEAMRVTTTECQDIFDDEIWNNSMCLQQQLSFNKLDFEYQQQSQEEQSSQQIRLDPQEEYFRLTMLALKIEHSEADSDMTVFTISEGKLYRMCKRKQVPFHSWHKWIDSQFNRVKELQKRAMAEHSPQVNKIKPASRPSQGGHNPILSWFKNVFGEETRTPN